MRTGCLRFIKKTIVYNLNIKKKEVSKEKKRIKIHSKFIRHENLVLRSSCIDS